MLLTLGVVLWNCRAKELCLSGMFKACASRRLRLVIPSSSRISKKGLRQGATTCVATRRNSREDFFPLVRKAGFGRRKCIETYMTEREARLDAASGKKDRGNYPSMNFLTCVMSTLKPGPMVVETAMLTIY